MTDAKDKHLSTAELADRWCVSTTTLRVWRYRGEGPNYIKLGQYPNSPIAYRLEDVEAYENRHKVKPGEEVSDG